MFNLLFLAALLSDTLVVPAPDVGAWGETTLVEDLSIGDLTGGEAYLLGSIWDLAMTEDGDIWVYDSYLKRIRSFDRNGEFLRYVGRGGEGPGEYRYVLAMDRYPDDTMVTWDPNIGRLTRFSPEGDYVSSLSVPIGFGYSGGRTMIVGGDGAYYVMSSDGMVHAGESHRYWVHVNPEGEMVDRVSIPIVGSGGTVSFHQPPGIMYAFVPMTLSQMSRSGTLIQGQNMEYSFTIPRPGSDPVRVVKDYRPARVKPAEREMFEKRLSRQSRNPAVGRPGSLNTNVPRTKPAFRNIVVDMDNRIWIDLYGEAELNRDAKPGELEWVDPRTFDVFNPEGGYLGRVVLPHRVRWMNAEGDHVYGIRLGEFDEQYIVRYRLVHN